MRIRAPEATQAKSVAQTNSSGIASLRAGAPGDIVEVLADGYRLRSGREILREGIHDFDVELVQAVALGGKVVDAETGAPIAAASILVGSGMGVTEFGPSDARGRFHIPGVEPNVHLRVIVRARGYLGAEQTMRIPNDSSAPPEVLFRLHAGGTISGRVQSLDGSPVEGATVRLVPSDLESDLDRAANESTDPEVLYPLDVWDGMLQVGLGLCTVIQVVTDRNGSFEAYGIAFDRDYGLRVRAVGYASTVAREVRVSVSTPERWLDLRLQRASILRVGVTASTGWLPTGRWLYVVQERFRHLPETQDENGRFVFGSLGAGPVRIIAVAPGYLPVSTLIRLDEGMEADVAIALDAGEVVEGVVEDELGHPMESARVLVSPAGPGSSSDTKSTTSDPAGRFSMRGVRRGPCLLVAKSRDGISSSALGTLQPVRFDAPVRGLRVVLRRGGSIRLRLVTPEGVPIVGAAAWSQVPGSAPTSDNVSAQGGLVEATRLPDGPCTVYASLDGFAWVRRTAVIQGGSSVDLGETVMQAGQSLSGRVVDRAGRPVAIARVRCLEFEPMVARTNEAGQFTLVGIPTESVTLVVEPPLWSRCVESSFPVNPSESASVEFVLASSASVRGTIRIDGGNAVRGGEIELRRTADDRESAAADRSIIVTVGSDGTFRGTVPPGSWTGVWVDRVAGVRREVGAWCFGDGEEAMLDIILPER